MMAESVGGELEDLMTSEEEEEVSNGSNTVQEQPHPLLIDLILSKLFRVMSKREVCGVRATCRAWNQHGFSRLRRLHRNFWVPLRSRKAFGRFNRAFEGSQRLFLVNFEIPNQYTERSGFNGPVRRFFTNFRDEIQGIKLEISRESHQISRLFTVSPSYFPRLKTLKIYKWINEWHYWNDHLQFLQFQNEHPEIGDGDGPEVGEVLEDGVEIEEGEVIEENDPKSIIMEFDEALDMEGFPYEGGQLRRNLATLGSSTSKNPSLPSLQAVIFGNEVRVELTPDFFRVLTANAPKLHVFTFPPTPKKNFQTLQSNHSAFFGAYADLSINLTIRDLYFCEVTDFTIDNLLEFSRRSHNLRLFNFGISSLNFTEETSIGKFWEFLRIQREYLTSLEFGNPFIGNISEDGAGEGVDDHFRAQMMDRFNFLQEFQHPFPNLYSFSLTTKSFFLDSCFPLTPTQFPALKEIDISFCSAGENRLREWVNASSPFPLVKNLYFSQRNPNSDEFLRALARTFPNVEMVNFDMCTPNAPIESLEVLWSIWNDSLKDLRLIFWTNSYSDQIPRVIDHLVTGIRWNAQFSVRQDGLYEITSGKHGSILQMKKLELIYFSGDCQITDAAYRLAFRGMKNLRTIRYDGKYQNIIDFTEECRSELEENGVRLLKVYELV